MKALFGARLDRQLSPHWLAGLGMSYTLLLGALDYATPTQMRFTLFYCLGIMFVGWRASLLPALLVALTSTAALALDQFASSGGVKGGWMAAWEIASQGTVFGALAWLVARSSKLTRHLGDLVERRRSQYEAMLSSAMDGFAAIAPNGRLVDANAAFCRMVGCTREEALGTSISALGLAETGGNVSRPEELILRQGSNRFETRLQRKGGGEIDVEISVSCVRGTSDLYVAFFREIGDRKRAEARLRESEERYRSLAETSPDAVFVVDRQLRILYANSTAGALWRRKPEQLLGVSQAELFSADTAARHAEIATHVFEASQVHRFDERIVFPAGERWVDTRLVPVKAADGKTTSLIVISVDISERKRTEFLLQAQKNLGSMLSLASELPTALRALLDVALTFEGVDSGGVYLRDTATGDLALAAHAGQLSPEFIAQTSYYPANSDRAKLVQRGVPVYGLYRALPRNPAGSEPEPELDLRAVAVVPLNHEGAPIGSLNLGSHKVESFPSQSRIGLELIAAQAAGAIARIRAEADRQRLQGQILEITDREQARIGQEIHDGLCQQLVSLAFDANSLQQDLAKHGGGSRAVVAARISDCLDEAITEARQLSRGLFPIRLEGEGLISALEELAASTHRRFGIHCTFQAHGSGLSLSSAAATHLFRIAQEAVSNALKHAQARVVTIQLHAGAAQIALEVEDNGQGLKARQPVSTRGMGLHIMDYRARSVGGALTLGPGRNGGTRVSCCIPSPQRGNIRV